MTFSGGPPLRPSVYTLPPPSRALRPGAALWLLSLSGCVSDAPRWLDPPSVDTEDTAPAVSTVDDGLSAGGPVACPDPSLRTSQGPLYEIEGGGWATQIIAPLDGMAPVRGLTIADLTGDGLLDVLLSNMQQDQLFVNQGDLTWEDETESRWTMEPWRASAAIPADVDGDGDLDVVQTCRGDRNRLYQNDGEGHFIEADAGLSFDLRATTGGSLADFDGDGDLDLFTGTHDMTGAGSNDIPPAEASELYENLGDGTYAEVSDRIPDRAHDGYTFLGAWIDLDEDGAIDLYLANDHGPLVQPNLLLQGDGAGGLTDISQGTHTDVEMASMGLGIGDVNGDATPDIVVAGWDNVALLESETGYGTWYDASLSRALTAGQDERHVAWGTELVDLDNDGDLDLAMVFGDLSLTVETHESGRMDPAEQPNALWLREGDVFVQVAEAWGFDQVDRDRALLAVDLNDDGFLDLVTAPLDGPARIFLSRCDDSAWLRIALRQSGMNPSAVGARIAIEADGQRWYRWIHAGGLSYAAAGPMEAHFGLGALDRIDQLTVTWPDGERSVFSDLETRQRLTIERSP